MPYQSNGCCGWGRGANITDDAARPDEYRGGNYFGGAGVTSDYGIAQAYAGMRTLRLADGPDEVHRRAIARLEYKKHAGKSL